MPLSRVRVLATVTVFGPGMVTVVPVMTGASQRNAGSGEGVPSAPSVAVHTDVRGTASATVIPVGSATMATVPPATWAPPYVHDQVTG